MAATTPEELAFIRSQYAGKLTMVDRWFGELHATLDRERLWDNTVVVVTTDHGHDLGERGAFGKQYPHYDSHAHIPLLVWHPDHRAEGRAVAGLSSTVDLFATVLDVAGAALPARSHSRSLIPLLANDPRAGRPALLYGTFGQGLCCTDGAWTILKSPARDGPLHAYSSTIFPSLVIDSVKQPAGADRFIPGVDLPQWRIPLNPRRAISQPLGSGNFLFHRATDPDQRHNLWHQEPARRQEMLDLMRRSMASEGTPPEQYARLGLDADDPTEAVE